MGIYKLQSTYVIYMLGVPLVYHMLDKLNKPSNWILEHKTAICTRNMDYAVAKHYHEANLGYPSSLKLCGIEKVYERW